MAAIKMKWPDQLPDEIPFVFPHWEEVVSAQVEKYLD